MNTKDFSLQSLQQSKHEYDLDIKETLNRLIDTCNHLKSTDKSLTENLTRYEKDHTELIKAYCHKKRTGFSAVRFIVIPSTEPAYENFLALTIAYYDIHKLSRFLDYQKRQYKGKENFKNLIEFSVYRLVEKYTITDRDSRLEKLLNWLDKEASSTPDTTTIKRETQLSLKWVKDNYILKKLSKKLFTYEFTARQDDFEKVFLEQKIIKWRGESEALAYLLFTLYETEDCYEVSSGKGYFSVASQFFCKDSENLQKKNYMSEKLHNVTKRSPQKHEAMRKKIDRLIKESKETILPK